MKGPDVSRREVLEAAEPRRHLAVWGQLLALALTTSPAFAATADKDNRATPRPEGEEVKLTTLTPLVEELQWLKAEKVYVTTVSKRREDPFTAAAAVHVITDEDIRRSGARSIPEALRLAPGLSVARMDANKWAITARGFNSRFADKLLILIDGRSVYSPTFTGVFWDVQDYLLADIDRIEVVRGPGGTLWGANAVNGVINIITKHSTKTTGAYFTGGYGTEHQGFGSFRYGAPIGVDAFARAYFKYRNHDESLKNQDSWNMMQGGFRADWSVTDVAELTVKGDAYHASLSHLQPLPQIVGAGLAVPVIRETYQDFGVNLLTRYERSYGDDSELVLQAYYDRTDRNELYFSNVRDTYDVDAQYRVGIGESHNLIVGAEYRYFPDRFRNPIPNTINYDPAVRRWQTISGSIQDDITLLPDLARLVLGVKLEHNQVTGFEYQPNARLSLTPTEDVTVWGAVSRAVQIPGRNLDAVNPAILPITPAPGLSVAGYGNSDLDATELIAYELGVRWRPSARLELDLAGFANFYNNLVDGAGGPPIPSFAPAVVVPSMAVNRGKAETKGVELSAHYELTDWWRASANYSYLNFQMQDTTMSLFGEGLDPQQQVSIRSTMSLGAGVELDLWGRFTDELPASYASPAAAPFIPPTGISAYYNLDARLAWKFRKNAEIALVGQNLIDPSRTEYALDLTDHTPITAAQRSFYVQLTMEF